MTLPIIYLDRSRVRPGRVDALREAFEALSAVVEAAEPRLLFYAVYFTDDGSGVSVVHAHRDEASLEGHMSAIAPHLASFADLLELQEIEVFGSIGPGLEEKLSAKLRRLGRGRLTTSRPAAGFLRLTDA